MSMSPLNVTATNLLEGYPVAVSHIPQPLDTVTRNATLSHPSSEPFYPNEEWNLWLSAISPNAQEVNWQATPSSGPLTIMMSQSYDELACLHQQSTYYGNDLTALSIPPYQPSEFQRTTGSAYNGLDILPSGLWDAAVDQALATFDFETGGNEPYLPSVGVDGRYHDGVLCSRTFLCRWGHCRYRDALVSQPSGSSVDWSTDLTAQLEHEYQKRVKEHLKDHAESEIKKVAAVRKRIAMRRRAQRNRGQTGQPWTQLEGELGGGVTSTPRLLGVQCLWEGCIKGGRKKQLRDLERHVRTHLSWRWFCPKCGKNASRKDVHHCKVDDGMLAAEASSFEFGCEGDEYCQASP